MIEYNVGAILLILTAAEYDLFNAKYAFPEQQSVISSRGISWSNCFVDLQRLPALRRHSSGRFPTSERGSRLAAQGAQRQTGRQVQVSTKQTIALWVLTKIIATRRILPQPLPCSFFKTSGNAKVVKIPVEGTLKNPIDFNTYWDLTNFEKEKNDIWFWDSSTCTCTRSGHTATYPTTQSTYGAFSLSSGESNPRVCQIETTLKIERLLLWSSKNCFNFVTNN